MSNTYGIKYGKQTSGQKWPPFFGRLLTRKSLLGTIFMKGDFKGLEYVCYANKVMNPWITSSTLSPSTKLFGTRDPFLFSNLIEL
jgi:hypothetical protein